MTQADIYTRVTNEIIAAIEKGAKSFRMPWHSDSAIHAPRNAQSQRFYRGVNAISLWAAADARGYDLGLWATYRQWQELGAQVRKGEKSTEVVFWKTFEEEESEAEEKQSEEQSAKHMVARAFYVFNAAQVDGFQPANVPELPEAKRIQAAETFFSGLGLDVRYGGNKAYYDPRQDFVGMPEFRRFRSAAGFYSTLGHETVHWSGAPRRLDRKLHNRFGSLDYAAEELIAELGTAFLAARLGTFAEYRGNHAAYIASWLELLRTDKRAIFTAASKAQQAVDWLVEQSGAQSQAA